MQVDNETNKSFVTSAAPNAMSAPPCIESHPVQYTMMPLSMPLHSHWSMGGAGHYIPHMAPSYEQHRSFGTPEYNDCLPSSSASAADIASPMGALHPSSVHSPSLTSSNTHPSVSSPAPATLTSLHTSSNQPPTSELSSIKHSDVECPICYMLLCEPITLTCGHSFCRQCMVTCYEQLKKQCPVCRTPCFVQPETHPTNFLLSSLIQKFSPAEYAKRLVELEHARQRWQNRFPVFLCPTPFFPNQPLALNFFEPRYKLMMQHIISSTRKFAVIPPTPENEEKLELGAVGTIFEILQYQMLPDGRFQVHAIGRSRVSVSEWWVEPDTHGLVVACVAEIDDNIEESLAFVHPQMLPESAHSHHQSQEQQHQQHQQSSHVLTQQELALATQTQLHTLSLSAHDDMKTMLSYLPVNRSRLTKSYGVMPGGFDGEDIHPPSFPGFLNQCVLLSFWLVSALPLETDCKLAMLRSRCTCERLSIGVKTLHGFTERLRLRFEQAAAASPAVSPMSQTSPASASEHKSDEPMEQAAAVTTHQAQSHSPSSSVSPSSTASNSPRFSFRSP